MKSFDASIVSDVYELKFEELRVNIFEGSIRLFNVSLQPREKPLNPYPYINSSFRFKTYLLKTYRLVLVGEVKGLHGKMKETVSRLNIQIA